MVSIFYRISKDHNRNKQYLQQLEFKSNTSKRKYVGNNLYGL
jgi:hypothetical protein